MFPLKCFFAIALLKVSVEAQIVNSGRAHLSDFLKLKCDSLLYRTAYVDTRCYFAVPNEVNYDDASSLCSSIMKGSKVATDVPASVFNAMMIDDRKFHAGKDSAGTKQSICYYDSGYECDGDFPRSSVIPGKCVVRDVKPRNYVDAESFCKGQGMDVPTISNDQENKMVRGGLGKNQAWIRNVYNGETTRKWQPERGYGRFTTCDRKIANAYAGAAYQMNKVCNWRMSSQINTDGYWENDGQNAVYDTMCVKNADNVFTKLKTPTDCEPLHEWDDTTGRCEWTGPTNACAQLIDFENRTFNVPFPKFPSETFIDYDLLVNNQRWLDNNVVKVIVRRGCMYTGYAHCLSDVRYMGAPDGRCFNSMILTGNKRYGVHNVPSEKTKTLTDWWEGLTRNHCFCDPAEATVNDHLPEQPSNKKCVTHHVYNAETKNCEWKHDPKYCAEVITNDGRKEMIEIPNWPNNLKYDSDDKTNPAKRADEFLVRITDIIVRQHCWATLLWGRLDQGMTLPTKGYGRHQVNSYYNGLLRAANDGTHRIVCECIR